MSSQKPRLLLVAGISAYAPYLLASAWCMTGYGLWSFGADALLLLPIFFAGFPVLLLPSSEHKTSKMFISIGLIILFVPMLILGTSLHKHGLYLGSLRAEPMIEAIHKYEREAGKPPEALSDLVPKYISALPERIPKLKIISGKAGLSEHPENRWILIAPAGMGLFNWDEFLYYEAQNYADSKLHDRLEKIGTWAYYNE